MKLVTKDSARRAVCFAANCKNELEEISNCFGSDDMLIDKHSKMEVLQNALFEPVHIDIFGIVKIAELVNILKDEIVTVKGKLVSISRVKKVLFREEACNKNKSMIFDPSDNIQIVLWEGLRKKDSTVGKTCILKNF